MSEPPPISLLDGLATTRAIRRYTDDPVPDDDLASILWHAGRAPSGSNRQPFRFLVLRDGERAITAKRLLGDAFRAGWNSKRQADGYRPSRFADSMQRYVDRFEQTPVVILVCLVRYRDPSPYEGASVYPACQNLLLAARALGYGGVLREPDHPHPRGRAGDQGAQRLAAAGAAVPYRRRCARGQPAEARRGGHSVARLI